MQRDRKPEATGSCERPTRAPLSRERILDAAVGFVDEHCLEDLSMRRLGAELGVEAMSLYRYVPSKASLLEGIAERLFDQLDIPDPDAPDWQEEVRRYARSVRRLAHEHPRLFALLVGLGPSQPAVRRIIERMTAMWRTAGFTQHVAFHAQRAVVGYVMGATLWEVQVQQRETPVDAFVSVASVASVAPVAAREAPAEEADGDEGPTGPRRRRHRGTEAGFEFGLEMLLTGLEQRLEQGPGRGEARH